MFTNLSNHPGSDWPKEQYSYAATRWGRISDFPFPAVTPEKTEEDVLNLVKRYLKLLPGKEEGPVFVAGEGCSIVLQGLRIMKESPGN